MAVSVPASVLDAEAPAGDCCDSGAFALGAVALRAQSNFAASSPPPETTDISAYVNVDKSGVHRLNFFVDNMQCASCIRTVEHGVKALPGVTGARVNMSTRRLVAEWRDDGFRPQEIIQTLYGLGYPAVPFDPAVAEDRTNAADRRLLSCLAVAGFAAANVMLLSVSVWAGAFSDMGAATRDLFHWISACIALPAVVYAGQPFFRSAFRVLRAGHMNMDVPISLAVILAAASSLHQTILGREHAYFDASVTLLFFLLIGRYLDQRARSHARATAAHLLGLTAAGATVIGDDGERFLVPVHQVMPGTLVHVAMGARIPVDGVVESGQSEIDTSLVTGETLPTDVATGAKVFAGTLNLSAPLQVRTAAAGQDTLLGEIVRLVEAAEQSRSRFVRVADRAARIYAPTVHVLALATFLGWWGLTSAGLEHAMMTAIAVLIITCPCALGLAVPAVQVVAAGVLLKAGVLIKNKDGLERLAQIDTIVFDKTGTLTQGRPTLENRDQINARAFQIAAAVATHSSHPLSRATVQAFEESGIARLPSATNISEVPGKGLSGIVEGLTVKLGSPSWCGVAKDTGPDDAKMQLWLCIGDGAPLHLTFSDELRADAASTIEALKQFGYGVSLLSGDRQPVVAMVAQAAGIGSWQAECLPTEKAEQIERLSAEGRKVLMVGDGLNDAPALALGHASISPASGADISQAASDFVFQGDHLIPVLTAVRVARMANGLLKQNIAFAAGYNIIAVPIAVLGLATPLVAAAAMSMSSLIVSLNAFRLRFAARK